MKRLIMALICLVCTSFAFADTHNSNSYLLKPRGTYNVGYQNIHLINKTACPDAFYHKKINENDFSKKKALLTNPQRFTISQNSGGFIA